MTASHTRAPLIERIGFHDLGSVAGAWDRLLAASPNASPFLTSAWLRAWADTLGADSEPCIVTARHADDGSLVGVAPFAVARMRHRGVRYRALRFMGTGPLGGARLDFLTGPDPSNTISQALWNALWRDRTWDLLDLAGVAFEGRLATMLHRRRGDAERSRVVSRTVLVTTQHAQSRERAPGRLRLVASYEDAAATMQAMARMLDSGSQRGRSRASIGHPSVAGFHREAARRLLDAGRLRLWTLDVSDATVGAFYGLRFGDTIAAYSVAAAPGNDARRVLRSLVDAVAGAAADEGAHHLIVPRGLDASPSAIPLTDLHVTWPAGPWGRIICAGRRLRTRFRHDGDTADSH